ncbi:hypothetical protein Hanom_Chr12g01070201 [Helianthus anomalus]
MFSDVNLCANNCNIVVKCATLSLKSSSGEVLVIAMRATVDDINSDPNNLQEKRLNLSVHDANFSGFLSIISVYDANLINWVKLFGSD